MDRSRTNPLILLIGSLLILGLSLTHVELRLVDFLAFCGRAQELGTRWVDPLYPPYYPALLRTFHLFTGDALAGGRAISGIAAVALLALALRNERTGAIALLCAGFFLQWASTEGTDMPAAALTATAILLAARSPRLAGLSLALALGCRYTALAALPSLLWLSSNRKQSSLYFFVASAPIWLPALALGQLPFDMSSNQRGDVFQVLLPNLLHCLKLLLSSPLVWLGLPSLVRKDRSRTHQALILTAGLHVLGCSFLFANPRLLLPAFLCITLCVSHIKSLKYLLPALGLAIVIQQLMPQQSPNHAPPPEIVDRLSAQSDCFVSNTPWAHQRTQEGWLRPGISILEHQHNRQTELSDWLHQQSCAFLVIDLNYPYPQHIEDGLELEQRYGHWRLFRL